MCLCLSPKVFCLPGAALEVGFGGNTASPESCRAAEVLHSVTLAVKVGRQSCARRSSGEAAVAVSPCSLPGGLAVGLSAGGHQLRWSSDISKSDLVVVGCVMSSCHADAPWEAAK